MKKFEILEQMLKCFDSSELLDEVIRALDESTALDVLTYIATVHDVNLD